MTCAKIRTKENVIVVGGESLILLGIFQPLAQNSKLALQMATCRHLNLRHNAHCDIACTVVCPHSRSAVAKLT